MIIGIAYTTAPTGVENVGTGYFELAFAGPVAPSNFVRIPPNPGIVLPDPRLFCCFSEQVKCIEIDGRKLTMVSGKVSTYGQIRRD